MKKRTLLAVALAAAVLATPAMADDATREKAATASINFFKKHSKKAKDADSYAKLVMELVDNGHPKVATYLGGRLMKVKDIDQQMIIAAALNEFRNNDEAAAAAGEALHKALDKSTKFEVEVVDSIVDSIGKLKYQPAVYSLCDILKKGGDPWLLLTTVRAVGNLEDKRALPTLLELWERHPVGVSWETGEVTVDTGAAGTADQEAAEAQWKAKYGATGHGKGKPPVMFKVYLQELVRTVARITGEKIGLASDLRIWMEEHSEELAELGVEVPEYKGPPKKKKDDD